MAEERENEGVAEMKEGFQKARGGGGLREKETASYSTGEVALPTNHVV